MLRAKLGILFGVVFFSIFLLGGCRTLGGLAKGAACSVGATAQGIAQDTRSTYNFIMATDRWIRKNLW